MKNDEKERTVTMEEQKVNVIAEGKKRALGSLRNSEMIYMLVSACTKMPFVLCDPETYDDEIFLFDDLEEAKKCAEKCREKKQPVNVGRVANKQLLPFYSSLYTMGVNGLVFQAKGGEKTMLQLEELVKRGDTSKLPDGKVWVENPTASDFPIFYAGNAKTAETRADRRNERAAGRDSFEFSERDLYCGCTGGK